MSGEGISKTDLFPNFKHPPPHQVRYMCSMVQRLQVLSEIPVAREPPLGKGWGLRTGGGGKLRFASPFPLFPAPPTDISASAL